MSNKLYTDSNFKDEFIQGAARAFFVMAYADYCEENSESDILTHAGPGGDWMDCAPDTPIAAYVFAGEMWSDLAHANKVPCGVIGLANLAKEADGVDDIDVNDFGHRLAMQYMGTGVSWFDDHEKFELEVPYSEISQFSFDSDSYYECRG